MFSKILIVNIFCVFISYIYADFSLLDFPEMEMPSEMPEFSIPGQDMVEALDACQSNIEFPDIGEMFDEDTANSESGICLTACIKKQTGIITSDNRLDMEKVREKLGPLTIVNPQYYRKLVKIYKQCAKVGVNETDDCKAFKKIKRCVQCKKEVCSPQADEENETNYNNSGTTTIPTPNIPDISQGFPTPTGSALPGIDVPKISTPNLPTNIPGSDMLPTPSVLSLPGINRPQISTPNLPTNIPGSDMLPTPTGSNLPGIDVPKISTPNLPTNIPGTDLLPNPTEFDLPEVDVPTPNLPTNIPGTDILPTPEIPNLPDIEESGFPSFGMPKFPSFEMPEFPSFEMPELPGFFSSESDRIPYVPESSSEKSDTYSTTETVPFTSSQIPPKLPKDSEKNGVQTPDYASGQKSKNNPGTSKEVSVSSTRPTVEKQSPNPYGTRNPQQTPNTPKEETNTENSVQPRKTVPTQSTDVSTHLPKNHVSTQTSKDAKHPISSQIDSNESGEQVSSESSTTYSSKEHVSTQTSPPRYLPGKNVPSQTSPRSVSEKQTPTQTDTTHTSGENVPSQMNPKQSSGEYVPSQTRPKHASEEHIPTQTDTKQASEEQVPTQNGPRHHASEEHVPTQTRPRHKAGENDSRDKTGEHNTKHGLGEIVPEYDAGEHVPRHGSGEQVPTQTGERHVPRNQNSPQNNSRPVTDQSHKPSDHETGGTTPKSNTQVPQNNSRPVKDRNHKPSDHETAGTTPKSNTQVSQNNSRPVTDRNRKPSDHETEGTTSKSNNVPQNTPRHKPSDTSRPHGRNNETGRINVTSSRQDHDKNHSQIYCVPGISVIGKELTIALEYCKTRMNFTTEDVYAIMQHQVPRNHSGQCLLACVLKNRRIMGRDNRYDIESVKQRLEPLKTPNIQAYERALFAYERCAAKQPEETNECIAFKRMRACLLKIRCKRQTENHQELRRRNSRTPQQTKPK